MIANDLHDSMLNLKMKKLEQKITQAKEELKTAPNDDEMMILLARIKQYEAVRMAIGKELNRVIT